MWNQTRDQTFEVLSHRHSSAVVQIQMLKGKSESEESSDEGSQLLLTAVWIFKSLVSKRGPWAIRTDDIIVHKMSLCGGFCCKSVY